jgi:hypothetical protein
MQPADNLKFLLDYALWNNDHYFSPRFCTSSYAWCSWMGRLALVVPHRRSHNSLCWACVLLHDACLCRADKILVSPKRLVHRPRSLHCGKPRASGRSLQGWYAQPSSNHPSASLERCEGLWSMASVRHWSVSNFSEHYVLRNSRKSFTS